MIRICYSLFKDWIRFRESDSGKEESCYNNKERAKSQGFVAVYKTIAKERPDYLKGTYDPSNEEGNSFIDDFLYTKVKVENSLEKQQKFRYGEGNFSTTASGEEKQEDLELILSFRKEALKKLYSRNLQIRKVLSKEGRLEKENINLLESVAGAGFDQKYSIERFLVRYLFKRNGPYLAYDRKYDFGEALEDPAIAPFVTKKSVKEYKYYRSFLSKLTKRLRLKALRIKNRAISARRHEMEGRGKIYKSEMYPDPKVTLKLEDDSFKCREYALYGVICGLSFSKAELRFGRYKIREMHLTQMLTQPDELIDVEIGNRGLRYLSNEKVKLQHAKYIETGIKSRIKDDLSKNLKNKKFITKNYKPEVNFGGEFIKIDEEERAFEEEQVAAVANIMGNLDLVLKARQSRDSAARDREWERYRDSAKSKFHNSDVIVNDGDIGYGFEVMRVKMGTLQIGCKRH